MKIRMMILAICLCAALVAGFASGNPAVQQIAAASKAGGGSSGGGTGGKVDPTAATIEFWDRTTDQITSDGLGPYVHGGNNITCQVQQNYPSQEILLNLWKGTKVKRRMGYDLSGVDSKCV